MPVLPEAKALAQDASSLSLEDIVQKALTAYGGKESLAQVVAGSTLVGKKITETDSGKVEAGYRCMRKGDKWRLDIEAAPAGSPAADLAKAQPADSQRGESDTAGGAGETRPPDTKPPETKRPPAEITACDGRRAWRSQGKDLSDLSKEEFDFVNEKLERQPTLLTLWQEPGVNFKLVGPAQYKDQPVFAVEVGRDEKSPTTLYIDQKNYLVVALTYKISSTGAQKGGTVAVDYSEYRPSGGTLLSFRQVETVDDKTSYILELTSASIGGAIDDAVFDRPRQEGRYKLDRNVVVPFEYSQNEIIVKVRINNSEDLLFLLDTGASDTIVDRRIAAQNFLAKQGQWDIAGYAGLVAAQRSQLKRMEIGGLILNDVPVRVLDLSQQSRQMSRNIAGIIGTNIISQFALTIDYSKPSLTFGDLETFERPARAVAVPFVYKQLPFVRVLLNGKDEQILLVDTGAAFNHLPTKVAQRHIVGDPANVRHVTEGTGLDGRPVQLGKVVIDNLSIGGLPQRSVSFTYPIEREQPQARRPAGGATATPERQERTGFFQNSNFGILGNPFWQNFTVLVDYRFQRLLLIQNPTVKLRDEIETAMSLGDQKLVIHRDYRAAEAQYQRGLILVDTMRDSKVQARLLGRMGNLRRIMAKDLNRPEHAKAAYQYFVKAQEIARKVSAHDVEGRVIADWSLLYSDNGQHGEAKQTIDRAIQLAPQDPNVNVDAAVHLYRAKLYPEMQKYIEKALFLEPSNWQALWYQVKLSEMFMDTPRAVATLKDILRFYPWSKVATDKLKKINESVTVTPIYPRTMQPPTNPMMPNPVNPMVPRIAPAPGGPRVTPWAPQQAPPNIPMIVPGRMGQQPSSAVPNITPSRMSPAPPQFGVPMVVPGSPRQTAPQMVPTITPSRQPQQPKSQVPTIIPSQ